MLQLVQNPKTGKVEHLEVPEPAVVPGFLLVQTLRSAISAGTERHILRVGGQSLLRTAMSRPDLVERGMKKLRRDGLGATLKTVRDRTQQTTALGYSSCGRVLAVGEGVSDIRAGDRVACAGAGYAAHAEIVAVPRNLAVTVPDSVPSEQAAFATIGAIALHGVRLSRAELGDNVAVIGLGVVGQITVQLLVAAGCKVLAIDLDPERVELARRSGAAAGSTVDLARNAAQNGLMPAGEGWDAVIITADSSSNAPLELAAELAREKGRVVAVGLVRTDVPRQLFYNKELELLVSRSYGPGRYDPSFEIDGIDYPYAYVRWTETRNMEAFVDLLARKRVDLEPLISHRFKFAEAPAAYRLLLRGRSQMAMTLEYRSETPPRHAGVEFISGPVPEGSNALWFGIVGAGAFARTVLLPTALSNGFIPVAVVNRDGLSARTVAEKFGFRRASTDFDEILRSDDCETVFITSPHADHSEQVRRALDAKRHVFVEKPLAVRREELDAVAQALASSGRQLMVGFNRRFSPFAQIAKGALADVQAPFQFHYRVNAGPPPEGHWILEPRHGGRVVGEVCHFIDLMSWLAAGELRSVGARSGAWDPPAGVEDIQVRLEFSDGSGGVISYVTTNRAPLAKERLEIWCGNHVIEMEDFKAAWFYLDGKERNFRWRRPEKGHREQIQAFAQALREGSRQPVPFDQIYRTSLAAIEAVHSATSGETFRFD